MVLETEAAHRTRLVSKERKSGQLWVLPEDPVFLTLAFCHCGHFLCQALHSTKENWYILDIRQSACENAFFHVTAPLLFLHEDADVVQTRVLILIQVQVVILPSTSSLSCYLTT